MPQSDERMTKASRHIGAGGKSTKTPVRIWVNRPNEPDKVIIGVD